jgi:hypothetical protein
MQRVPSVAGPGGVRKRCHAGDSFVSSRAESSPVSSLVSASFAARCTASHGLGAPALELEVVLSARHPLHDVADPALRVEAAAQELNLRCTRLEGRAAAQDALSKTARRTRYAFRMSSGRGRPETSAKIISAPSLGTADGREALSLCPHSLSGGQRRANLSSCVTAISAVILPLLLHAASGMAVAHQCERRKPPPR